MKKYNPENEELRMELLKAKICEETNDILKTERKISDELYAIKLAQYAIFAVTGFICITVIGYLIQSVFNK